MTASGDGLTVQGGYVALNIVKVLIIISADLLAHQGWGSVVIESLKV